MEMTCAEAQEILAPYPGPTRSTPEAREAFAHYETCPACKALFEDHRRLADSIRRVATTQRAPDYLRARILETIEAEQRAVVPTRPKYGLWVSGAIVAAAAALTLWLGGTQPLPPDQGVTPLIAALTTPDQPLLQTTSAPPLASWFVDQQIRPFEIPDIDNADLVGGRVTQVRGITSPLIDFVQDGIPVTYVMVPDQELLRGLTADGILTISTGDYEVAAWLEDGTFRAVLSRMPREQLLLIAEQCKYKRTG